MEAKLFWKSVIRKKGSLLLLWLLIAASTFGFMLRAVEYLAVHQEIERISQEYRPIGSLNSLDGEVTKGVSIIADSPYVEFTDINRYCPAILSNLYNADLDGNSGDREDGELKRGISVSELMAWGKVTVEIKTDQPNVKWYDFIIEEGVYGYPDYLQPGTKIQLKLEIPEGQEESMPIVEKGKSYLMKGYPPVEDNIQGFAQILNVHLLPLEDGLWLLEGTPDSETAQKYLGEDFELQERNRHAMMAFSTKDMSAMPLVQEVSRDFYLEDGRWITKKDQDEGNRVCVVSKEFADVRGLSVGDSLTMTFQDRNVSFMGYATPEEDTWESSDKTEETLEIVGIYGRMYGGMANSPGWTNLSYRSNVIYVPDCCIPEHYVKEDIIFDTSFSFVLADPKEKDLFLREMEDSLAPLGISITFVENNWDSFYQSAQSIEQGGFYSLVIFTALLVLTLTVVVFLYTWQRRKECAIARALGVPAKRAVVCACLPLMVLGIPGILAGGILAWRYGLIKAGETLAALESEGAAELSWFWLVGILLVIWALLVLALFAGNFLKSQQPVLEVLQGRSARHLKKTAPSNAENEIKKTLSQERTTVKESASVVTEETASPLQHSMAAPAGGTAFGGMLRFIGRHLYRFSLRALFALLAVLGFLSASCWLWNAIQSGEQEAEKLYRSTEVEAEITKKNSMISVSDHGGAFISSKTVQEILDTGFVKDYTLIAGFHGTISKMDGGNQREIDFVGVEDVEECLPKMGNEFELHYGDGYSQELFDVDYTVTDPLGVPKNFPVIFLPDWLVKELEAEVGELFVAGASNGVDAIVVMLGGVYTQAAGAGMSIQALAPLSFLEFLEKDNLCYMTAEFSLDPAKNRELEEFRQKGEEIIEASGAGLMPLSLVIWDEELRQVVEPMEKNITLMKILYPLANTVAFLAAIGLSILFLFQRRREAAILRVLGVGTLYTRMILVLELLIVDLVGILLGALLVHLLIGGGGPGALPVAAGCYFLGCLSGAILGAVLVTRGRPLELLQGKE